MKDKHKFLRLNDERLKALMKKYLNNEISGKSLIATWDSLNGIAEKPKKLLAKENSVVFYSIPKD